MSNLSDRIIVLHEEEFKAFIARFESLEKAINSIGSTKGLDDTYVNNKEACAILKITSRSLAKLRDRGLIKYSKPNGVIYYALSDIQNYIKSDYNG